MSSSPAMYIPALPAAIAQPVFTAVWCLVQLIRHLVPLILAYGLCFAGLMLIVEGNLDIAARLILVFLFCKFAIGWDRICGSPACGSTSKCCKKAGPNGPAQLES
ncbi:hypothetical protein F4775DRAFT_593455 [Biscogniauxia sp. FL1348]|nr:hypothetical protein F4775DRAFT_593455 [Biscogniauxia sp. FL1348]